ncbi:hypothetical protein H9Y04_27315 [Streptomyces sp. TRM66268-LWL]|uniref:Cytochrome b/b6 domain-containing protein n=1 Tax=Streptomyces polyasparticus TaxID=2767826 RepID=A0ABR7SLE5_9ACTN|nr:hypothetical protein [Streptomyces polyasparticus]
MLLLIPVVVTVGGDSFRAALDFTTGVLCLVSLTCSIIWGLVASDRLFLSPKQRLLAQGVHRATAIAALGFLLLHGTVKLVLGHVSAIGALIPFGLGVSGTNGLIGFGALAGLLMITTGVTGALRSSFASPARIAGRWRALHMLAYPAWCSALVHGLYAGREAASWVVAMYCLCLAGVTGALALRAAPLSVKRKVARGVFALLDAQPRVAPGSTPRRGGPLPGMDAAEPDSAAALLQLPPLQGEFTPSREFPSSLGIDSPQAFSSSYGQEERPRPGDGMAAAYRAVSSAPGARPVPLQEEHGGRWPAPSPPPPGEAARPASPAPAASASPAPSGEPPYYATSDPYDTGSTPTYGSGPISPYDTGQTPLYQAEAYRPEAYRSEPHRPEAYRPEGYRPETYAAPEAPAEVRAEAPTEPILFEAPAEPAPNPFEAPAAGEPWSAPGTAGGRR